MEHDDSKPDDAAQIIGRFGIGFYSVFMVAKKVEVTSVSATGDGTPHVWTSDGTGSFTIRALEGTEAEGLKRGTSIKIYLRDDAHEYEEKYRLEGVIRKHSNFLPFAIQLDGERVNTTAALWREPKFSITKEQYNEFYKFLTFDQKEPLDVIHFSVDAPVQFNCLLYIPGTAVDVFDERKDEWGPDLYVRRVLIDRHNKELLPNYFAFMKGVVDTEDLPLNISRETLQENVVLRKISQTITRSCSLISSAWPRAILKSTRPCGSCTASTSSSASTAISTATAWLRCCATTPRRRTTSSPASTTTFPA